MICINKSKPLINQQEKQSPSTNKKDAQDFKFWILNPLVLRSSGVTINNGNPYPISSNGNPINPL